MWGESEYILTIYTLKSKTIKKYILLELLIVNPYLKKWCCRIPTICLMVFGLPGYVYVLFFNTRIVSRYVSPERDFPYNPLPVMDWGFGCRPRICKPCQ